MLTSYNKDTKDVPAIEDNNELSLEQKIKELDNRKKEIMDMARELEERKTKLVEDGYKYYLVYRYEPYYIFEGWNYMEKIAPDSLIYLSVEDVQNMLQQNILQLENNYKELIMTALSEVISSDRYRDILITTDLFNNAGHHGIRITVSVNIDGTWKIKYNEKGKPVLRSDGSIEREYIPISSQDIYNTNLLIQHIIGYDKSRGDSITVFNIPFDRTNEFKIEDSLYLRQKKSNVFFY
jgi:hypothetical protein